MFIRIGYEFVFQVETPSLMLMMLALHPDREYTVREHAGMIVEPYAPVEEFADSFGNRCRRIFAQAGRLRLWDDMVVEDSGQADPVVPWVIQHPAQELPPETLVYLLGSRYCEVDRLSDIAWSLFAGTPLGWGRVQAVCDWVHHNVRFDHQSARPTKTAYEVFVERTGVCRDFAHLALTLCRCLCIPARYATGYLGDIGVPPQSCPMDFSGWFEVYLGGRWHTFDARHNVPRIGRVLMARGRDAVDVAMTTSFGKNTLESFRVWTDEVIR
ncbi:MAG: transglutaminase family protein [Isosphaeraceae bacterium]|nr:transglutaminase family protein [Isosphaeraceae bacterium]